MKKVLLTLSVAVLLTAVSCIKRTPDASRQQVPRETIMQASYTCPMHPEIQSDQMGTCPKCGMDLVKTEADAADSIQSAE